MVKFVLIRHGYSIYNKERRFTGQQDIPLDEIGIIQAKDTAEYVLNNFHIDAIYSSDLSRAIDTASPIAEALSLPINTDIGLREINAGHWQTMLIEDIKIQYPDEFEQWANGSLTARCGGGETRTELADRCMKAIERIAEQNEGKTVAIASHGGSIRSILSIWSGNKTAAIPNAAISVVDYDRKTKKANILMCGYNDHLSNSIAETAVSK